MLLCKIYDTLHIKSRLYKCRLNKNKIIVCAKLHNPVQLIYTMYIAFSGLCIPKTIQILQEFRMLCHLVESLIVRWIKNFFYFRIGLSRNSMWQLYPRTQQHGCHLPHRYLTNNSMKLVVTHYMMLNVFQSTQYPTPTSSVKPQLVL